MTRPVIPGTAAVRLSAAGETFLQGSRAHVADRPEFLFGTVTGLDELFDVCRVNCPASRLWDRDRVLSACLTILYKTSEQDTVSS